MNASNYFSYGKVTLWWCQVETAFERIPHSTATNDWKFRFDEERERREHNEIALAPEYLSFFRRIFWNWSLTFNPIQAYLNLCYGISIWPYTIYKRLISPSESILTYSELKIFLKYCENLYVKTSFSYRICIKEKKKEMNLFFLSSPTKMPFPNIGICQCQLLGGRRQRWFIYQALES